MNYSTWLFTILATCFFSCTSMNSSKNNIEELQKEIMLNGNIEAYSDLMIVYLDYPADDRLFWSMIMANKYDYPEAYYEVYLSITDAYEVNTDKNGLSEMDERTRKFALEYLKNASDKGVDEAKITLADLNLK